MVCSIAMKLLLSFALTAASFLLPFTTELNAEIPFHPVTCEGSYPRHVQGVCTNGQDAIYWSWTESLVKTDLQGKILKKVAAPDHQGDLCYHDGKLYVAVNLGKFNQPAGKADSWVFVYDADTLAELSRHPVPELVHGAGGMAYHEDKFIIIGGLTPGTDENYAYEYDANLKFIRRHTLASGYTLMGIQTVAHAEGAWWFGCYGKPAVVLRADEQFKITGKWEFNAAVGIIHLSGDRFLIAENKGSKGTSNTARLFPVQASSDKGFTLLPQP